MSYIYIYDISTLRVKAEGNKTFVAIGEVLYQISRLKSYKNYEMLHSSRLDRDREG